MVIPPEDDLNNPKVIGDVCARLASGETTNFICRTYKHSFARRFWIKMRDDPDFATTIEKARMAGVESLVSEIIEIADNSTPQDVAVDKLRVHARQWYITKMNPKKYGDRTHTELTGTDGAPLVISWQSEPK